MSETMALLVEEFADAVRTWANEYQSKDAALSAKRSLDAFMELRNKYGDRGRDALKSLLKDSSPYVRSHAAAFLLRHCTSEAVSVLDEVARGKGMVAFSARQALERWKEGTWALDPQP